jgi:hypothetical protein
MKIFRKKKKDGLRKGAITVFLTVILVPCLVFASVFTDLSRVELAKARAVSAADLSLNTILAHYDPELKELYGMMSSVQSPEEFMKRAEKYFVGMLKQSGVDDAQSALFIDAVRNLINGEQGKTSNFLKMSFEEEPTISAAENGKLTNPVLIEDQIVEFMKYRGIPVIVQKLLERFKVFGNQTNEVKKAEEYEPTANAKQEYAKAEGELMEAIFNTYFVLFKYQQVVQDYENFFGISGNELASHFESLESDVKKIWNDYKKANELAILRYIAADDIKELKFRPNTKLDMKADEEKEVKDSIASEEEGKYYLTQDIYDDLIREFDEAYQKVTQTAQQIRDKMRPINEQLPSDSDVNEVIYAIEVQRALQVGGKTLDEDLETQVKDLVEVTKKMEVIQDFTVQEGETLPSDWKTQAKKRRKNGKQFLRTLTDGNDEYQTLTSRYMNLVGGRDTVNKVKNRLYTFTSEYMGADVTLDVFTHEISERYSKEIANLTTMIDYLTVVINGGDITIDGKYKNLKELQKLRELVEKYVNTKNDWSNKAHGIPNNEHGQKDVQEIEGIADKEKNDPKSPEAQIAALEKSITIEALNELKQRLQNTRSLLENAKNALEKQTFGDIELADVSTGEMLISTTKSYVSNDIKKITMSISSGKEYANPYNDQLVKPSEGELYKKKDISRKVNGNDPNLDNVNPTDHIPPLYAALKKHFGDPSATEQKVDQYKKQNDEFTKQGDEKKKSALRYDSYLVDPGTGTLPAVGSSGGMLSQLKELAELIGKVANGDITEVAADARDKLFVIEYIMDMFSHATYSNEAWYKREEKANGSLLHADNWDALKDKYSSAFKELNLFEYTDNVSLTNQLISNEKNALYLAEVEYCLYGKATLKENLEASFGDIFKIRFASNTLSGFINFWRITDKANGTAIAIETISDAIQAATMGIIPAPLTKAILILALATIESANDLEVIKKGLPVTFYKLKYDSWKFALDLNGNDNGSIKGDDGEDHKPEDPHGLYYSDYMYAFLVKQALGNSSYTTLLNRVGKLVEGNMKLQTGKDWKLDNCIVYYQLEGEVKVDPLMLTLPLIQSFDANGRSAKDVIKTSEWAKFKIKQTKGYS